MLRNKGYDVQRPIILGAIALIVVVGLAAGVYAVSNPTAIEAISKKQDSKVKTVILSGDTEKLAVYCYQDLLNMYFFTSRERHTVAECDSAVPEITTACNDAGESSKTCDYARKYVDLRGHDNVIAKYGALNSS